MTLFSYGGSSNFYYKELECDSSCYQKYKNELLGKWKRIQYYYGDTLECFLNFNEDDSVLIINQVYNQKFNYEINPNNYVRYRNSSFYKYRIKKNDTLIIDELVHGPKSSFENNYYIDEVRYYRE